MPIPLDERQRELIPYGVTFDPILGSVIGFIMDGLFEIPLIFVANRGEWQQRDDAHAGAPRQAQQQAAPMQVDPFMIQPNHRQGARLRVEKPLAEVKEFWWDRPAEVPQIVELPIEKADPPDLLLFLHDDAEDQKEFTLLERLIIIKDNLPNPPPELAEVIEELANLEVRQLDAYEEGYERGRADEREDN